ncbi:MAG: hypothetical protein NVS2B3_07850 [Vulcanimicrobiaceae bacterium]
MFDSFDANKAIEEAKERHERAEGGHGGHGGGAVPHARYVPVAAATLAVVAAIGSMLSNKSATEALQLKNDAILRRTEASDSFAFYQARSIKEHIYRATADANPALSTAARAKLLAISTHEKSEKAPLLEKARGQEEAARSASERSERASHTHEILEGAVTLFEVAIAVVSISALTSSTFLIVFGAIAALLGLCLAVYGETVR